MCFRIKSAFFILSTLTFEHFWEEIKMMNLLAKFEQVQIQADARISAKDREICEGATCSATSLKR